MTPVVGGVTHDPIKARRRLEQARTLVSVMLLHFAKNVAGEGDNCGDDGGGDVVPQLAGGGRRTMRRERARDSGK